MPANVKNTNRHELRRLTLFSWLGAALPQTVPAAFLIPSAAAKGRRRTTKGRGGKIKGQGSSTTKYDLVPQVGSISAFTRSP